MSRSICKTLTLAEQVEVLKQLDLKESQSSIAQQFGVNQSAILRIQKNKDKIIQEWQSNSNPDRKRKRTEVNMRMLRKMHTYIFIIGRHKIK